MKLRRCTCQYRQKEEEACHKPAKQCFLRIVILLLGNFIFQIVCLLEHSDQTLSRTAAKPDKWIAASVHLVFGCRLGLTARPLLIVPFVRVSLSSQLVRSGLCAAWSCRSFRPFSPCDGFASASSQEATAN